MKDKQELLHLSITQYGAESEGKLALLLDGFTTQAQVDHVIEQFNKFMKDQTFETAVAAIKAAEQANPIPVPEVEPEPTGDPTSVDPPKKSVFNTGIEVISSFFNRFKKN